MPPLPSYPESNREKLKVDRFDERCGEKAWLSSEPSANFHVSFFDGFFADFRRFYLSSCAKEISSKTWIIPFSRKHLDLFSPTHSLLPILHLLRFGKGGDAIRKEEAKRMWQWKRSYLFIFLNFQSLLVPQTSSIAYTERIFIAKRIYLNLELLCTNSLDQASGRCLLDTRHRRSVSLEKREDKQWQCEEVTLLMAARCMNKSHQMIIWCCTATKI